MKRLGFVVAVLLAACTPGLSSDEYLSVDTTGLYAAALAQLDAEGHLDDGDVVYVVQPSLGDWLSWCDEPDPFNEQPDTGEACDVVPSIENEAKFTFAEGTVDEVEAALRPATVRFVNNYSDALVADDGSRPPRPVKEGARLIAFSVALESQGMVYLHIDLHGHGVLIEAAPHETGWIVEILLAWIA